MAARRALRSEEEIDKQRQKDRERKAKQRALQSSEEKARQNKISQKRMAEKRAAMTEDEKETIKAKDRGRKKKKDNDSDEAQQTTTGYGSNEREFNRLYKQKKRKTQTDASHEYEIICNLLCMRSSRKSRSGKEHLLDNLEAKKGMQLLQEHGCLKSFQSRKFRDLHENLIWKRFMRRGKEFRDILKEKKPDLAAQIQEVIEKEDKAKAELEAKQRELEEKGIWWQNPADGSFWWTGKEPPGPDNPHPDDVEPEPELPDWGPIDEITAKEWDDLQFKWYCQMIDERKKEAREARNRAARELYHKRKDELLKPIMRKYVSKISNSEMKH